MDGSISSLTYKGSISNAIGEAQKQKKLFLVYISGEDEYSTQLAKSTWLDQIVAESISKYCIFLHLIQGTVDALQFSAIYPQKSFPSITAVGYNGVLLWQHEGYISPENLVGSIEKAWAAIHYQETALTLLTAALASKKPEPLNSSSPNTTQEHVSASDIASASADKPTQSSEHRSLSDPQLPVERKDGELIGDHKYTRRGKETYSEPDHVEDVKTSKEELESVPSNNSEVLHSLTRDVDSSVRCSTEAETCRTEAVSASPQENRTLDKSHITSSPESSCRKIATEVEERNMCAKDGGLTDGSNAILSDDIHLNIRLPNGTSFQRKFVKTDILRSVKNYVDVNQTSGIGSYDLAVPYPRKVFNEQDLNCSLSELGFAARQALIVVPHRQANKPQMRQSSSADSQSAAIENDSSENNVGYLGFVKRMLSYVNPLSYLGNDTRSSTSESAPTDNLPPYRLNSEPDSRYLSEADTSYRPGDNVGDVRRRTSRPFGSNIHTLRHDEDDFPSRDRNTFWNGNSTEFGGDDRR